MKNSIPLICSIENLQMTENFLREKGKSHLFSCIGTDFECPQGILNSLKDFTSKIVISGPAHESILANAGYYVIPLKSVGFNIIDTIIEAKKFSNKIVFIWRSKPIVKLDSYSEDMGLRIISTCCYSNSDIEIQVREFMSNGYNTFIGHRQVCNIVRRLGGNAVCYYTDDSWLQSVSEAMYHAQMFIQYGGAKKCTLPVMKEETPEKHHYTFSDIVGSSSVLQETIRLAKVFAETNASVLITGETGTGKELFAQSIHAYSSKNDRPFLAINCASISESLLESELFGYEKGAFTGAAKEGKPGIFELAHGGTLFMDEIGEISPAMQVKFLRVLQEKQIRRIGARNDISIDVRIIAATNQDIDDLSARGQFRNDLYYRLNVLRLDLPPLRERREDIPDLVYALCKKHGLEANVQAVVMEILHKFKQYEWPGNVRELENIVQRLAVMEKCRINDKAQSSGIMQGNVLPPPQYHRLQRSPDLGAYRTFKKTQETEYLNKVLARFNGNKTKAAQFLGISRTTLWAKLKMDQGSSRQ